MCSSFVICDVIDATAVIHRRVVGDFAIAQRDASFGKDAASASFVEIPFDDGVADLGCGGNQRLPSDAAAEVSPNHATVDAKGSGAARNRTNGCVCAIRIKNV